MFVCSWPPFSQGQVLTQMRRSARTVTKLLFETFISLSFGKDTSLTSTENPRSCSYEEFAPEKEEINPIGHSLIAVFPLIFLQKKVKQLK